MDCPQLQQSISHISNLRNQYLEVYFRIDERKKHRAPENIQAIESLISLMEEIKSAIKNLEKLFILEIAGTLELQQQYEKQKEVLIQTRLLETLSNGESGIIGIDGKEYPIPTFDQIIERIRSKEEVLKTKAEQGFKKLILVPLGMPLSTLIECYKQTIIKHYQEHALKAVDGSDLVVDVNSPIYVWVELIQKDDQGQIIYEADKAGDLIYFPSQFDESNHQGQTKAELLKRKKPDGGQAWQVLMIEDLPDLPAEKQGQTIAGRKQLEAGQTSYDYLKTIQTQEQYQHEQGLTLESWIIYAITQLQEKNQVIEKDKACYFIGSYQKKSDPGGVLYAYWDSLRDRQAHLSGHNPTFSHASNGCRFSVEF